MNANFTCVDLFAGIGGFRLAAERCGGRCIGYSEIFGDAISTYERNYPDSAGTNLGDITKIKGLPPHDLLTGGVPCQSWSIAGRNLGFDDDRGQLWNDALYLLNTSRPKAFIFENVKGLADPRNKSALEYIQRRIAEAGYFSHTYVLNAFDYGVPQSRVRIYIIGFRERKWLDAFRLPPMNRGAVLLRDILNGSIFDKCESVQPAQDVGGQKSKCGATSLSTNNNGFNDYFLFNDLRNGQTTIHSWDIIPTTEKEKRICLLLLKNRRKDAYGVLDGNPLSLEQLQTLDPEISSKDILKLCSKGILKPEAYRYRIEPHAVRELSEQEKTVLRFAVGGILVPDEIGAKREVKVLKIDVHEVCERLAGRGMATVVETRYDFKNTKISTGLNGINRIFLPTSNIFPTLVASDTSDYVTDCLIDAPDAESYRARFLRDVYEKGRYRKITKQEACRIQGFPDDFVLPASRPRWMHLIGNSVAVRVIEQLIRQVCNTGVFGKSFICPNAPAPMLYEECVGGQKQMLLAVERKKAKMTETQKNQGRKGKAYVTRGTVSKGCRTVPKNTRKERSGHG